MNNTTVDMLELDLTAILDPTARMILEGDTDAAQELAAAEADWPWADSLLQDCDFWPLIENHIDGCEFLPEAGHVYQLDCGNVMTVTPEGNVVIG